MTWTREHIAAFGGNPEDVTIFGESAGGNSVINHLAQEASFGLYTKAVVESGAYNLGARNMSAALDPMSRETPTRSRRYARHASSCPVGGE